MAETEEKERKAPFLIFLLAALIITTCFPFQISVGALKIRIDVMVLFLVVLVILLMLMERRALAIPPKGIIIWFITMLFVLLLSTFLNQFSNGDVSSLGDVTHELARISKYAFIFLVFWFGAQHTGARESIQRVFIVSAVAIVTVAFMQYFDILGMGEFTYKYFSLPEQTRIFSTYRVMGGQRVSSTFWNANILSMFLLMPLGLCFAKAIIIRKWYFGVLTVVFFSGILVTQARAIIVLSVLLLSITMIIVKRRSHLLTKKWLLVAIFIITILLVMSGYFIEWLNLERATQISMEESSLTARIDKVIKFGSSTFERRPIFGFSPAADPGTALENEYLIWIYYYGIMGLIIYIIFLFLTYKYIPKDLDPLNVALSAILIIFLFTNMTHISFHSERVFTIFLMIYATGVSGSHVSDMTEANSFAKISDLGAG